MVNDKKIIAVIPARGGSKRLPRKNIMPLCGKPMIAWTIEAAQLANIFDDIIVSTDDQEIADVAIKHGAQVPFLRERFADDLTPVSIATANCIERLNTDLGKEYDVVAQLMPNCPLRKAKDIREALEVFLLNNHSFQISSFAYGWMNPWWAHTIDEHFTARPLFSDEKRNQRSQDQEKLYCPSGAIWIAKVPLFLSEKTFYGPAYRFVPLSWTAAMDIDDAEDLKMAEVVMKLEQ